jgi:hypothetical protein
MLDLIALIIFTPTFYMDTVAALTLILSGIVYMRLSNTFGLQSITIAMFLFAVYGNFLLTIWYSTFWRSVVFGAGYNPFVITMWYYQQDNYMAHMYIPFVSIMGKMTGIGLDYTLVYFGVESTLHYILLLEAIVALIIVSTMSVDKATFKIENIYRNLCVAEGVYGIATRMLIGGPTTTTDILVFKLITLWISSIIIYTESIMESKFVYVIAIGAYLMAYIFPYTQMMSIFIGYSTLTCIVNSIRLECVNRTNVAIYPSYYIIPLMWYYSGVAVLPNSLLLTLE